MKTLTHGQVVFNSSHAVVTLKRETHEIITNFTSSDYIQNAVHVHMTPSEARKYAQQLIIYADRLDPLE